MIKGEQTDRSPGVFSNFHLSSFHYNIQTFAWTCSSVIGEHCGCEWARRYYCCHSLMPTTDESDWTVSTWLYRTSQHPNDIDVVSPFWKVRIGGREWTITRSIARIQWPTISEPGRTIPRWLSTIQLITWTDISIIGNNYGVKCKTLLLTFTCAHNWKHSDWPVPIEIVPLVRRSEGWKHQRT